MELSKIVFTTKIVTTDKERELAFAVRKKVFVEEQGVPVHLELDEYDEIATHFIVLHDNETIAAARLREIEPKIGKVERVCVLPEYRGKHLGVLIMETVEKFAIEQQWAQLKLNAQSYAVPFYEKIGYDVTSPEFMDADIPHRAMKKNI